jgi:hypothetical protein
MPQLVIYARQATDAGRGARLAVSGRGNERAVAAEAARMFALTDPNSPGPRIVTKLADITSGMGLEATLATRVQNEIATTTTRFEKKGGSSKVGIARGALMQLLRSENVDPGARTEILARASAWWKRHERTDYGAPTGASAVLTIGGR